MPLANRLKSHLTKSLGVEVCHSILSCNTELKSSTRVFIVCFTPQFLANPDCMSIFMRVVDVCSSSGRKLYVLPMHPCTTRHGISTIISNINEKSDEGFFFWESSGRFLCHRLCPKSMVFLQKLTRLPDGVFSNYGLPSGLLQGHESRELQRLCNSLIFVFNSELAGMPRVEQECILKCKNISDSDADELIQKTYTSSIDRLQHNSHDIVKHFNSCGLTDDQILECFTHSETSSELRSIFDFSITELQRHQIRVDAQSYASSPSSASSQSARAGSSSGSNTSKSESSSTSASDSSHSSICFNHNCVLIVRHKHEGSLQAETINTIGDQLKSACQELGCCIESVSNIRTDTFSKGSSDIAFCIIGTGCDIMNQSDLSEIISSKSNSCSVLTRNWFSDEVYRLKPILERMHIRILPPVDKVRKGGYGTVYKCQYHKEKFYKAAKVVQMNSNKQGVIFRDEGDFLGSWSHDNVVKCSSSIEIQDYGPPGTITKVFIMEWMEHGDFSNLLDRVSESYKTNRLYITSELFLKFSSQILGALNFLHSSGTTKRPLLHRDIKPANILVHCVSENLDLSEVVLKLSDFGLSKEFTPDESGSSLGVTAGTRAYKCPQCFEPPFNSCPADDTWSASLVLVEMMCGFSIGTKGKGIIVWSDVDQDGNAHVERVNFDQIMKHCHPWLRIFAEPICYALHPQPQLRLTDPEKLRSALKKCYANRSFAHDVFICHDLQDIEFAKQLEDDLTEAGLKVYRASIGLKIHTWCVRLLDETARVVTPYLKGVLQLIHKKICDELELTEAEQTLLQTSGSKYKGGNLGSRSNPTDSCGIGVVLDDTTCGFVGPIVHALHPFGAAVVSNADILLQGTSPRTFSAHTTNIVSCFARYDRFHRWQTDPHL
jgi:serine/threonine protein kinase